MVGSILTGTPAMQVADVLDDRGDQAWVDDLGGQVADADWSDDAKADTMLCALLRLPPPHLLHRAMSACLTQATLEDFLTTAFAPLHAAAVSADLKDGVLQIPALPQ